MTKKVSNGNTNGRIEFESTGLSLPILLFNYSVGSYGTLSILVGHGFRYWGAVESDEVKTWSAESLLSMW